MEFSGFGSLGVFREIIDTGNVVSYWSYWSFNERQYSSTHVSWPLGLNRRGEHSRGQIPGFLKSRTSSCSPSMPRSGTQRGLRRDLRPDSNHVSVTISLATPPMTLRCAPPCMFAPRGEPSRYVTSRYVNALECPGHSRHFLHSAPQRLYRGTSLIRNHPPLGPYSRPMPRALWWFQGGGRFL